MKCQAVTTDLGGSQAGRQPARQHGRQSLSKALTFWGRECEILADICARRVCVCVLVGVSVCACEDSCVRHKPGSNDEEKARSEKIHQTRFKA